ncbi:MAG: hypothetical protein QXL17_02720 [Candidatus Thermoplasmatota archaeon]
MFINPKIAIEKGWIKGNIEQKNIQPNAIDFTLDKLYKVNDWAEFYISESGKEMRNGTEALIISNPSNFFVGDFWKLEANSVYDGMSNMYVEIPDGVAAYLVVRSTLNRNGLFITSGLYDSGFRGHIGFVIHNRSGAAYIAPGTRVGQVIFVESENALRYAGGWNHNQGTHYMEKK